MLSRNAARLLSRSTNLHALDVLVVEVGGEFLRKFAQAVKMEKRYKFIEQSAASKEFSDFHFWKP